MGVRGLGNEPGFELRFRDGVFNKAAHVKSTSCVEASLQRPRRNIRP
jgi:hypothetical protein